MDFYTFYHDNTALKQCQQSPTMAAPTPPQQGRPVTLHRTCILPYMPETIYQQKEKETVCTGTGIVYVGLVRWGRIMDNACCIGRMEVEVAAGSSVAKARLRDQREEMVIIGRSGSLHTEWGHNNV